MHSIRGNYVTCNTRPIGGYAKFPKFLFRVVMPSLSGAEWKVLCVLIDLTNGLQRTSVSIPAKRLASYAGLTPRTVHAAVPALKKAGWLDLPLGQGQNGLDYQLDLTALAERCSAWVERPAPLKPVQRSASEESSSTSEKIAEVINKEKAEDLFEEQQQHTTRAAAAAVDEQKWPSEDLSRIRRAASQVSRRQVSRRIAHQILTAAQGNADKAEAFIWTYKGKVFDSPGLWWILVREDWTGFSAEYDARLAYRLEEQARRAEYAARYIAPNKACPACSGEGWIARPAHVPEDVWGLGARECYCCLPDPDARLTRYAELERLCRRPDPPPAPPEESPAAASLEASGPSGTAAATSGTPRAPKRPAADRPKAPAWSLADRLSRPPRGTGGLVAAGTIAASLMAEMAPSQAPKGRKKPHANAAGTP